MYPGRLLRISRRIYSKYNKQIKVHLETDNYFGNPILGLEEGNSLVQKKIREGTPLMVARIGHTELTIIRNYFEIKELQKLNPVSKFIEEIRHKDAEWSDHNKYAIHFFSGFFPTTEENLYKFCDIYFESMPLIDLLGVWFNYYEDELANRFCPNAHLIPLQSIEPYYFNHPWSIELKDKKVLVIHPFEESIVRQFSKREKLFDDPNVLPSFNLQTIKAVQWVALNKNKFDTWFDGLDYMKNEINKRSFDIALIGAGAYGLPLAAYIKSIGKQAIHVGGALQIFFGIKGTRWDTFPPINKFYNENWSRPLPEETPQSYKSIENGCYW
jgi:hypothetical protein